MGRSAYSGRNWEGFSPDPYLSGIAMAESVKGFQDAGVQATAKHFILNEQEILRNPVTDGDGELLYESISSNADDRTVRKSQYSQLEPQSEVILPTNSNRRALPVAIRQCCP